MKFFAFAFIIGLCIVAVTTNATGNINNEYEDLNDYEFLAQGYAEEIVEIEPYIFSSSMYFILKKVLRTLKGLNCTIKEVIVIRSAANKFVDDVTACGGEVPKKVQTLIDACNDIIQTCKDILGINESVCGNTVEENEIQSRLWNVVSGAQNAHKCFVKMFRKLQTLNKQINRAVKLIKQIKNVPGDTSKCVLDAVNSLENNFIQFPNNIKTCSQLTSK